MKRTCMPKNRIETMIFLNKYTINKNGCFEYTGHITKMNYAVFGQLRLNRVIYSAMFGNVPSNICVCHTCDNRKCINPEHLVLGTLRWNSFDMDRKGRRVINYPPHPKGEKHPLAILTEKDVRMIRKKILKGNISQSELGRLYGVKRYVIWQIINRRTWKHI